MILVCRFLGAPFGSSLLAIVGGAFEDVWEMLSFFNLLPLANDLEKMTSADDMVQYSGWSWNRSLSSVASAFVGPVGGPIMGDLIPHSYLDYRWTSWITAIMSALLMTIVYFVVPKSFAPVLLSQKATKLQHDSKIRALHAQSDEQQ